MPTPLPNDGNYALLAGQFAALEDAVSLQKRASSSRIAATTIPVIDRSGAHWFVVAVGNYPSLDEARGQRSVIQRDLGIMGDLPVILLPDWKIPTPQ